MANLYFERLADPSSAVQKDLDRMLETFAVQPVGTGYIDIIVPLPKYEQFLAALTTLGIAAHAVTLWCTASETNKQIYGCPHGMGGPVHNGVWFSEICERDPFDVQDHGIGIEQSHLDPFALAQECNSLTLAFVSNGIKDRPEYSPCLAPGFWLAVPDSWQSSVPASVA